MGCNVIRKQGKIQEVITPQGQKSILFEKIAAHPLIESKEQALEVYKNLYSQKVREMLGEEFYTTEVVGNNEVVLNEERNESSSTIYREQVTEETLQPVSVLNQGERGAIVINKDKAELDTIILGNNSDPVTLIHELTHKFQKSLTEQELVTLENWSKHSRDSVAFKEMFAKGGEKYIYENLAETEELYNIFEKFARWFKNILSTYFNDVNEFNPAVKEVYAKMFGNETYSNLVTTTETEQNQVDPSNTKVDQAGESNTRLPNYTKGETGTKYQNQEPKLFFKTPNGVTTESYLEALEGTQSGNIEVGFKLGESEEFVPVMEVSSESNPNSKEGFINNGILKDLISENKELKDGEYALRGAGASVATKIMNSVMTKIEGYQELGNRSVSIDGNGFVTINELEDENEVTLDGLNGEERMQKQELRERLLAGEYDALSKKYTNLNAVVMELYRDDVLTEEELNDTPTVDENELKLKFLKLLSSMGIKVTNMSNYLARYNQRHGIDPSVNALADIGRQVVAFAKGQMTTDNLSEEAAHFLVEAFHDQAEVDAVLEQVEGTTEWEQFAGEYYQKYGEKFSGEELDNQVRREILGKILAKALKEKFALQGKSVQDTNVFTKLRDMFGKFVEMIQSYFTQNMTSELDMLVDKLSDLAVNNMIQDNFDPNNSMSKSSVFYSLDTNQSTFIKTIDKLQKRIKDLKSRQAYSESKQVEKLSEVVDDKMKDDEFAAVSAVAKSITPIVRRLKNVLLNNSKKLDAGGNVPINHADRMDAIHAQELFKPMVEELAELVRLGKVAPKTTGRVDLVQAELDGILTDISQISGLFNINMDRQLKRTTDEIMNKYRVPEEQQDYIKSMLANDLRDISYFQQLFGSLQHASNPFLNILGKIIRQNNNRADRKTEKEFKELQDLAIAEGWDSNKFQTLMAKDEKGNNTRFYKSPILWNLFTNNMTEARAAAYSKATGEVWTREKFEEQLRAGKISIAKLDTAQHKVFTDAVNEWLDANTERQYTDKYYSDRKEKMARLNISDQTQEWLSNHSQSRYAVLGKYYEKLAFGERLDYTKVSESDMIELGYLTQERNAAKDETDHTTGLSKEGDALRLSEDLKKLDQDFVDDMIKNKSAKSISPYFFDTIREIEAKEGGEEGSKKAFQWLMLNGGLNFNDNFWNSFDEADTLKKRVEKASDTVRKTDTKAADNILKTGTYLVELLNRRKSLLKQYQVPNNPAEVNGGLMGKSGQKMVAELDDQIKKAFKRLNRALGEEQLEKVSDKSAEVETTVNESYKNTLADSNQSELEFIKEHTSEAGKSDIHAMQELLEDTMLGFPHKISKGNAKVISKLTGIKDVTQNSLKTYLTKNSTEELLNAYGRTKVLPYFRRFAPAGYDAFIDSLKDGTRSVTDLLDRIENGTTTGIEEFVDINAKYSWTDDTQANLQKNPNYNPNFKGGTFQPKQYDKNGKPLYVDKSFFSEFGVSEQEFKEHKDFTGGNASFRMLRTLWDYKYKGMESYNVAHSENMYKMPQFSKGTTEKTKDFFTAKSLASIKNALLDAVTTRVDTQEKGAMKDGKVISNEVRSLVKYGLNDLEEVNDISTELLASNFKFIHSANMFKEQEKTIDDVMVLQQGLMNSKLGSANQGDKSKAFKMFTEFTDSYFYGVKRTRELKVSPFGVEMDLSAGLIAFDRFVRMMNIGFSIPVALTSYTTAKLFGYQEGIVGEYYSRKSSEWAVKEMYKLYPEYIKDARNIAQDNKLFQMGTVFGIYQTKDRLAASGFSKLARFANNLPYAFSSLANLPIAPKAMLAVLDDWRFIDGKFTDFQNFTRNSTEMNKKEIATAWATHRDQSLYNHMVKEGNTYVIKQSTIDQIGQEESEQLLDDVTNRIATVIEAVDSLVNESDKSAATRDYLLNFMTAHRSWFTILVQRKLKRQHFNTATNRVEEGHIQSVATLFKNIATSMRSSDRKGLLEEMKNNWNNLEPHQQKNVHRTYTEMAFFLSVLGMTAFVLGMADDDENKDIWGLQLAAYIMVRTSSELGTSSFPLNLGAANDIVEKPFMAVNTWNSLTDWSSYSLDEVESGAYEGDSKLYQKLVKLTMLKHWYQMQDISSVKKQFINANQGTLLGVGTK